MENQVGFAFAMPNNQDLYIYTNRPLTENEENIHYGEEIKGVLYFIKWGKKEFILSFRNQLQAHAAAYGIQWGAYNA